MNDLHVKMTKEHVMLNTIYEPERREKTITARAIALKAGYSESTVDSKKLTNTPLYKVLAEAMQSKVGFALEEHIDKIVNDVKEGKHLNDTLATSIRQMQALTSIYKGLMPTVKQKETTKNDDGSITTVWKTLNG